MLYQDFTLERPYLTVLQAITEAFLQMTFMVPQETSYQGRGGQKGKCDVIQDSLQCFQTEQNWEGILLTLRHLCGTYRVHMQASNKNLGQITKNYADWRPLLKRCGVVRFRRAMSTGCRERDLWREECRVCRIFSFQMEKGKVFCSLWKRSKHPVSCNITPKPCACVSWQKKMSRKGNSLPFRKIHSSLVIWLEYEVSPPRSFMCWSVAYWKVIGE